MMGYILYCDSGGFFALRSVLSSLYHVGLLGDTSIFFCLSSGQWSCVWVDLRSDSRKEVGQLFRVAENKAIYNHRQHAGGRDILWLLNVQYSILKCPPPVPILSQSNLVHVSPFYSLKIDFNIIFPSVCTSPRLSLSLRFPHQNPICTSTIPHTCHMPCPSHSSCDHANDIW
jgi:hypothetical protein